MNIEQIIDEMTLEEKASLCSGHDVWKTKEVKRFAIPQIMMCDGPHGLRKQEGASDHMGINEAIKTVCYPTASALAASFDRDLIYKIGDRLGQECQVEDVALLLGPGVNIKRSPLCGRNFEYFSEDPYQSTEMASAFIKGVQSWNIGACMKHYAANNQETNRVTSDSVVDERTLHEIYLASFEGAVKDAKPASIMCSYNKINGTYASEHNELLNGVLQNKWGFEGFVVTDWGAVKNRVKGLASGLDLEMPASAPYASDQEIVEAVKEGKLPMEVLDNTVRRMLSFVLNYKNNSRSEAKKDLEENYKLAVEAACECAVLVKNEHNILPLKKDSRIAFIGAFAEKPRYQGSGSSYINSAKTVSALEAVKNYDDMEVVYAKGFELTSEETSSDLMVEALDIAQKSNVVVVFAGLPDAFETEGVDRKHLELPKNQNELIKQLIEINSNVIVVLHNGAPVTMPWFNRVSAILEMYLAGDGVGEATVSLLYGEKNPSGKLSETFPLKLEDNPSFLNFPDDNKKVTYAEGIFVGYRYYDKKKMDVLIPFGHGLSYTSFEYSKLVIDKERMKDSEVVKVSLKVKNTGNLSGKEVVQLYIHDVDSTVRKPIRELKGFEKVQLDPGETKEVQFILSKRAFAHYDTELEDWYTEEGIFNIEVGSSSRDIRLSSEIHVSPEKKKPVIFTRETPAGELMAIEEGRQLMERIKASSNRGQGIDAVAVMGEGGAVMIEVMIREMPLGTVFNFAGLSEEQVEEILTSLNKQLS